VKDVDKALRGEVDVEGEVYKCWVHNDGEAALALFDNRGGENRLVIADRRMVTVFAKGLEVGFRGGSITSGGGAHG
jgi:hypothetical protein